MIIGKEALVNLERMFNSQYKIYPDSADLGMEVTEDEINGLRADCKTLKGIYKGTNIYPTPDSSGVKNIIIPIEECEQGVWRCMRIDVLVSRQFTNKAFIEIKSEVIDGFNIPFFAKVAA